MAIISNGMFGGFSGKVGAVIGYQRNGVACMRSVPATVANPRSHAQKEQRAKFNLALSFTRSINRFVKIGFRNCKGKMSAMNYAMSYTMKNAIRGSFPDLSIDYSNILVSKGPLTGALKPTITSIVSGEIVFSWEDNSADDLACFSDETMILAINSARMESVFATGETIRSDGTQSLTVPIGYSGEFLECYITFADARGKLADSNYIGQVMVA